MSWLPTVEIYCVQTCQQLFLNRLRQVVSKQGIQFLLCGLNNGLKNVRASDQWGKIYDGCVSHFPEKEAQQKHATWHVTKQSAGSKNGHIFSEPLRNLTAVAVYAKEKTVSKQNNLLPKKSPVFFCRLRHMSTSSKTLSAVLSFTPYSYIYKHVASQNLVSFQQVFLLFRLVYTLHT